MAGNIQSRPTPEMFQTSGGQRIDLEPIGPVMYALDSIVYPTPLSPPNQADSADSSFALDSIEVAGPIIQNVNDEITSSCDLQSLVVVTPLVQSETETANSSLALDSILVPSPVTRNLTDDANSSLALQSIVLP